MTIAGQNLSTTIVPGQTAILNIAGVAAGPTCQTALTVIFDLKRSFIRFDQRPALEQAFAFGLEPLPIGGAPVRVANRFMLMVGHTDQTGSDLLNNALSLQRARAVRAVFLDDADVAANEWESIYQNETWNGPNSELAQMSSVVDPAGTAVDQYVRDQSARLGLFRRYLLALRPDWLANEPRAARPGFVTTPIDAVLGCGVRHPVVNAPGQRREENRRVEFFFFRTATAPIANCSAYPSRSVVCGNFISIVVELTDECGHPYTGPFDLTPPAGGILRNQQTDAQGTYSRDNLPQGDYTIEVESWHANRELTATSNTFSAKLLRPVTVAGTALRRGGTNFRFFGTNAYYLLEWEGSGRHSDVENFFELMRDVGIYVVRTWGFNEDQGKPQDSITLLTTTSPPIPVVNPRGLDSLSRVVDTAEQFGIYLIITLSDYNPSYGGICQYARWAVRTPPGFNTSDPHGNPDHLVEELFYTGSITSAPGFQFHFDPRAIYLDYVCHVINRFRGRTNILGWELMNEPRVKAINAPSRLPALEQALRNWIGTTAATIRLNCDPSPQLLSIGGVDINLLHFIFDSAQVRNNIDLMDTHLYPENFGLDPTQARNALMNALTEANTRGKPFYLGEFGLPQGTARNRPQEYQDWATLMLGGGAAGMLFWQLLPNRPGGAAREAFDPFEINVDLAPPPRLGLQNVAPPPRSTHRQPPDGSPVIGFVNQQLLSASLGGWSVC
jgi:Cellulase (glycosyl hydrolase family 5)